MVAKDPEARIKEGHRMSSFLNPIWVRKGARVMKNIRSSGNIKQSTFPAGHIHKRTAGYIRKGGKKRDQRKQMVYHQRTPAEPHGCTGDMQEGVKKWILAVAMVLDSRCDGLFCVVRISRIEKLRKMTYPNRHSCVIQGVGRTQLLVADVNQTE